MRKFIPFSYGTLENASEPEPRAPTPDVVAPGKPEVLYQEIQIQRTPQFSVAGTVFAQDLKYKLLSELRVSPFNEDGRRQVDQIIQRAVLIEADDMSRAMFTKSLKELEGWQFSATLNRRGEVIGWHSGPKDGRETVEVKPEGMEGFLVTSVMDEDGWKELTQLSFFVPDPKTDGQKPWTRQMTHDYGPLGSWYGLTHFRRNETAKGLTRYSYEHELTYQPPEEGIEGLPFTITDARFLPEVAEGYLDFSETAQRVESAHETFVLKGQLATEILGQRATIDTVEQQTMILRLSDEKTW